MPIANRDAEEQCVVQSPEGIRLKNTMGHDSMNETSTLETDLRPRRWSASRLLEQLMVNA